MELLKLLLPLLLLLGGSPVVSCCDETRMLEVLSLCGEAFSAVMGKEDTWRWCDLSAVIGHYESFTNCTEQEVNALGCFWPNWLTHSYITAIHRQFFSNCSMGRVHWEDPPDEVLIPLILLPLLLMVVMVGLVVWRSQHADQLL